MSAERLRQLFRGAWKVQSHAGTSRAAGSGGHLRFFSCPAGHDVAGPAHHSFQGTRFTVRAVHLNGFIRLQENFFKNPPAVNTSELINRHIITPVIWPLTLGFEHPINVDGFVKSPVRPSMPFDTSGQALGRTVRRGSKYLIFRSW